MKTIILLFSVLLLTLGCAGPGSPASVSEPYVKPGLIMLTADQAAQRGIAVDSAKPVSNPLPTEFEALDESAVVTSSGIKVYTISRAVDPADRDVMHEQHVVYRRESAPQWRLQAASGRKLSLGPSVSDGRQDLQPLLDKELTTFLSDQRRATEANQRSIAALFQAVDALSRQQQTVVARGSGGAPAGSAMSESGALPETGGTAPASAASRAGAE